MGRKSKVSAELKPDSVQKYLTKQTAMSAEAKRHGVNHSTIRRWITAYETLGIADSRCGGFICFALVKNF